MSEQIRNYTPLQANVYALPLFFILSATVLIPHSLIWGSGELSNVVDWAFGSGWTYTLVIFLPSIVVHELLHGVGFLMAGAPRDQVKFGVHWKLLTPYATTKVAMTVSQYRLACALPGIVLGIVPAVVGTATGQAGWTVYGAALSAAACGDALVIWSLRRLPAGTVVRDSETNIGCEVVTAGE